jgi:hypothetical protein
MIYPLFRISTRSISGPYARISLPGLIHMRAAISFILLLAVIAMVCGGCGGSSVTTPPPAPQALSITTQPSTQGVRLGQVATFSVVVSGSNPITYQWSKNGSPIIGATSAAYTTPATVATDNDSTFNVTITNGAGSVTSGNVRLLLNTPKAGDLRFQQVDAVATRDLYLGNTFTAIDGGIAISWGDYGSPFQLTPQDHCGTDGNPRNCSWFFSLFSSPAAGLTTSYQSGLLSGFQNDLSALSSDTVITSMDIEPANNAYATSTIKSAPAGAFTPVNTQSVLPSDFQTAAAQEAAVGHVITAVGFNAGSVIYVSYGWQSDTSTVYETSVATATLDTVPAQAASLAQQGYIITAIGGDTTNGFLLVGTRVQGDTMPRPFKALTSPAQDVTDQLWGEGYALVASIVNGNDTAIIWIGEK